MMNRGYFKPSFVQCIKNFIFPDYVMKYLEVMRKASYYSNRGGVKFFIPMCYYNIRHKRLGIKLGFSIGKNVFGYGLKIPHYGTIVVGDNNRCGNYCVLHTSTCISGNGKSIGNALYLSTGAKITAKVILGDNITVAANSVITHSFPEGNALLVSMPAVKKQNRDAWYIEENSSNKQKVDMIEKLKLSMSLA